MRLEDLSKEDCDGILSGLRNSFQYINLRKKYFKLCRKGLHQRAEETRLFILHLEEQYLLDFIDKNNKHSVSMRDMVTEMQEEDYKKLLRNMHMVTLIVDILDSRMLDIDDILKKYEGQFSFDGITTVKNIRSQCTDLLDRQRAQRVPKVEQLYADTVCSIEDNLFKRVDTLIRRLWIIDDQYRRKLEREEAKKARLQKEK